MFTSLLNQIGNFSSNDIQLFAKEIKTRAVTKDTLLLSQGEICKSAFFNLKGAFFQYNYQDEIELNVIDLHPENEWFLNHSSFTTQKPSLSYIKAYTNSEVLELSVDVLHHLIAQSPAFLQLGKILDYATNRVYFFDNRLTPTQKYLHVLKNKPELLQQFPLKIIASYLKVSPETLSRVREGLAKGKIIS